MNVYMIVPFKISFIFLVVTFSLCRPDLGTGSGELLTVCASRSVRAHVLSFSLVIFISLDLSLDPRG